MKTKIIIVAIITSIFLIWTGISKLNEYNKMHPSKYICTKSHVETKYSYDFGINPMNGKAEYFWGLHTKTICDKNNINPQWIKVMENK